MNSFHFQFIKGVKKKRKEKNSFAPITLPKTPGLYCSFMIGSKTGMNMQLVNRYYANYCITRILASSFAIL